ncbi:MAG: beta-galactosidase [Verrucomicrobiae bacterium]|nr:beta-galactosidase [Verrucomicrobiae bacterium]
MNASAIDQNLDFFPYGVQYHRAPTPLPEEWDGDLRELARAGYTHVQFRPQWRLHERIRGVWVWDDLDRLFDLAEKHGLRVILKPMLETAPDWVFDELHGTRIGFHGVPISPIAHGAFYVGGWLPCFDNPEVMRAAARFVEQLAGRYKAHPALWFYNAWNEPRSRPLGQCQCPHSVRAYQGWLRERFGTVEELNRFYGKGWTSLESVRPPQSAADYAEMHLWRKWAMSAVAGHIRRSAEAIKRADAGAFVMCHAGCCSVVTDIAGDGTDDLQNVRAVDRYGTSWPVPMFPATPPAHVMPDCIGNWLRRVDPRYWLHEFYPQLGEWAKAPAPVDLKRLIWQGLACGGSGFTFWQYRSERVGNESNMAGLREIDGSPSERSRVADEIGGILKKHGRRLAGARRLPGPVAQFYSLDSDLISRIQRMEANGESLLNEKPTLDYFYKRAAFSAFGLFSHGAVAPEWAVSGDSLEGTRLLVVSAAEMVDETAARWIREYVEKGGSLLAEFPFACRDANTWVSPRRPAHGLDELLGCCEEERLVAENEEAVFWNGVRMKAKGWKIRLTPQRGEILARWPDGSPAAVETAFGRGKVISLGISLSLSCDDTWEHPARSLVRKLAGRLGVDYGNDPDGVLIRRCAGPDYEILFAFNVTDKPVRVSVAKAPAKIWTGEEFELKDGILTVPPRDTWVAETLIK